VGGVGGGLLGRAASLHFQDDGPHEVVDLLQLQIYQHAERGRNGGTAAAASFCQTAAATFAALLSLRPRPFESSLSALHSAAIAAAPLVALRGDFSHEKGA
jgi:hypothetical protein